ncbi:MAG TPA: enolase C-terminal domain-like protein [Candidatus Polarisedimenticolia bacterium]|nr:enolase C-terminal domain-like protein [Candidatus Polarisedimenticolia bacterium]
MKITDISVQVIDAGKTMVFADRLIMNLANVVVRVKTDEGLEGVAGASTYLGATGVAAAVAEMKPLLIGEDPLYREKIWQRLNEVSILMVPPHSIAVLDCALWDLAGRAAGLPVYKLLGAQRDRVTAYASSLTYSTLADFQREIDAYLKSGFRAVKLHVWGDPDRDIELCTAIRKQVGPAFPLMVDAVGSYSLNDALRVGRKLDELGFEWFEMPLRDSHIAAYKTLADALDIAVTSGEVHTRTYQEAANYLTTGAWDILRIDALISGGITATKKAASLAEALGLRCEIHSFGYTLNQAANLQVIGSVANSQYFECPMPLGEYGAGMLDVINLEPDGTVCVPNKPGLGVEVDWEKMDALTVARF